MKITTWNVNGLRAAIRKGFAEHLGRIQPDILLLQEIRVLPEQLDAEWRNPNGWHVAWHPARKKGYAGTAVWSREPLEVVDTGTSEADSDEEGRLITVRIGELSVSSVYLPSGSSRPERQIVKDTWMQHFRTWADERVKEGPVIFGGDLNIAHTERDIFYAKSNEKTSGFLPHERQWLSDLLKSGWSDAIRDDAGEVQGPYSWWSNRGRARELDRGWRIDYLLANQLAQSRIVGTHIDREAGLAVSDHAPVTIELA